MINCMFLGLSTCKNDIVKVKCWLILSPWPVMSKSEAPSVCVGCWQKGLIVYGERENAYLMLTVVDFILYRYVRFQRLTLTVKG